MTEIEGKQVFTDNIDELLSDKIIDHTKAHTEYDTAPSETEFAKPPNNTVEKKPHNNTPLILICAMAVIFLLLTVIMGQHRK